MSKAIVSQGFQFEIGSANSPPEFTEVKEITSFTGFDGAASEIDVTHMRSTAKEFLMGLQDFGTFQMDVNYIDDDPGQVLMRAAKASAELTPFKLTLSNGATAEFFGFVTTAPMSGGVDAKIDGSFNVRISGDVSFTAGD